MLDPQRLLGALIRQGVGSKSGRKKKSSSLLGGLAPGGIKGAVGLGIIGVAVAAFDHFMESRQPSQPPPGPVPPLRPSGPATPPPPPPAPSFAGPQAPAAPDSGAMLLVRAMIAAAASDGRVDDRERSAILAQLRELGLSDEERDFVARELDRPGGIETVLPHVDSPELARQVYAVSLLAIEVDTPSEAAYLHYLQQRLGLDDATAAEIRDRLAGA